VAGRDQYVAGRDQVVVHGEAGQVLAELAGQREALAGLRLTEAERAGAERDPRAMGEAVRRPEPDTGAAGRHLHWLGPVAAGVLALAVGRVTLRHIVRDVSYVG